MTSRSPFDTRITLSGLDSDLVSAWESEFSDVELVSVQHGDIFRVPHDALVSPANSFGFMDGGLDLLISQRLGWHIEERVRERVLDDFDGEVPVGVAFSTPTGRDDFRYLITAPTMRVPSRVDQTANAHLAFRAILREVWLHDEIRTVACPGLGTGEGRLAARLCARQMRAAWAAVVEGQPLRKGGLAGAVRHHLYLIGEDG